MRNLLCLAAAVAAACGGDDGGGPTPSPFGLDERPANPTCIAKARPVINTGVSLQRVFTGINLQQPIYAVQAPGDTTGWYVVQRTGTIRFIPDGANSDAQTREFASVTVNGSGEGGLLGFAFHPQWPARKEAYLSFTRNPAGGDPQPPTCANSGFPMTSVVARFKSTDGTRLDMGPDEILKVGQPYSNHNGGTIQFGRDGMLYWGLGDGGSGNDPCASGQALTSLLGKILRIDIEAGAGMYNVPTDNPFTTTAGARGEIWSYGHRNPWRWSFDRDSGDLWVGEVGQDTWEEIDRVEKGGNYGWRTCEGFHRRGNTTMLCNTPGLKDPIVEHPRSEARSITGGYVYHGASIPSLAGVYIYGDYETGNIWALLYDGDNKPQPKLIAQVDAQTLVSFGQGNDGEVYTVQINGVVSKLAPAGAPPPDTFPKLLSQTGCVDPNDATKPASGLIPYDVNSPLWSDNASKDRWLAIPDGQTIAIGPDGDWDLPIGSVAVKTFSVDNKRLETRLFMRHDDGGWGGYTYEWNDAGTDATLLAGSKAKALDDTFSWGYPSRTQCLQCHSKAAGGTLGFETAQLNRDVVYPATNRLSNQLATLDHIGMFTVPMTTPPDQSAKLSDPKGTDPLEDRARSYLHANCSHCHRPMGGGQGMMDLRIAQSFKDTVTCNADNTQGTVGGANKLIVPGMPAKSVLSTRFHSSDSKRMPPVAVSVLDPVGSAVLDEWITSLTACPP